MIRYAIRDAIRLIAVALGICLLMFSLVSLWEFYRCKTAQGVVETYSVVEYGRTNTRTRVAYTRDDGTRTVVMSSDIPASAKAGERLTVVYDPERIKNSWLLGNELSFLAYVALAGVALTSLGLFLRRFTPASSIARP